MGDAELSSFLYKILRQGCVRMLYKEFTWCEWDEKSMLPLAAVNGSFEDPIKNILWLLKLSKKYYTMGLNSVQFLNAKVSIKNLKNSSFYHLGSQSVLYHKNRRQWDSPRKSCNLLLEVTDN